MRLKIQWCLLVVACWCVTLAFSGHNIQTSQRQRRATQEELEAVADQLDSVSAVLTSVPGLSIAGSIFGGILSLASFFVRIAAGTQEDAESRLMAQFVLLLNKLDNLEAKQDEIKEILEWSYYKSQYASYIRTIEVLFEDATQLLENPQNSVLKDQIKSRTASDTSVDEFFNFVTRSYLIQEDTLFEAAFEYFENDMRKTQALMKDSIGWLIQGMVVQMVAPMVSGYSGSTLNNHLDQLSSKWQSRMTTALEVINDLQEKATRNAIDYITVDTNAFFKRYPDKSKYSISYLRGLLERELNIKYFYTKTRVVGFEDDHHSSCVYSQKPQYTCDGKYDRKRGCPEGRNFAIFTYPEQYELSPYVFYNEVYNERKTQVLWRSGGGQEHKEFIANSMFQYFTRIVIDQAREYSPPLSDCFIVTEQEIEDPDSPPSWGANEKKLVYNFITLVDVCSPINKRQLDNLLNRTFNSSERGYYVTPTQDCNGGSFVKTLSLLLLLMLVFVVLYVV